MPKVLLSCEMTLACVIRVFIYGHVLCESIGADVHDSDHSPYSDILMIFIGFHIMPTSVHTGLVAVTRFEYSPDIGIC
jgi:hypothetical protein